MSLGSASPRPLTPANLTAFLVVHTAVPMMQGTLRLRAPVVGQPMHEADRVRLGLMPGGSTVVYEMSGSNVVMDLVANTATISFMNGDAEDGLAALDGALAEVLPSLAEREDIDHPRGGGKRLRVYEGDVTPELRVKVEADYPLSGAAFSERKFVVRVSAFQRMARS